MDLTNATNHIQSVTAIHKNRYSPSNITIYEYWAKVMRVIDGDTLECQIELGFDVRITKRFRLIGVNTPETHGVKKTSEEFRRGTKSKEFVERFIEDDPWVELEVYCAVKEKYGRWLCQVFQNGVSLNAQLLVEGLASPITT